MSQNVLLELSLKIREIIAEGARVLELDRLSLDLVQGLCEVTRQLAHGGLVEVCHQLRTGILVRRGLEVALLEDLTLGLTQDRHRINFFTPDGVVVFLFAS